MKFFKSVDKNFFGVVIPIALIAGFGAGIVGELVSSTYIEPWRQTVNSNSANEELNNTTNTPAVPELKRVKKFLGIQQDFEVTKSVDQISPSVVGVYLKKTSTGLNQLYLPKDLLANAFILTSDGWLLTDLRMAKSVRTDQLVIAYNQKMLPITTAIADPTTGITFIKVQANNLPVVALGDSDALSSGQLVVSVDAWNDVAVNSLRQTSYIPLSSGSDVVSSTEEYRHVLLLSDPLTSTYVGSPVVNLAGEVVGIVNQINTDKGFATAVPFNQLRSVVTSVLRNGKVQRPLFGVRYIDLATAVGIDQTMSHGLTHGALIFGVPAKGSPAATAGITSGDIITSIDGQTLDEQTNLTDVIQQYHIGDSVDFDVWRNGKTIPVTVVLGSTAK